MLCYLERRRVKTQGSAVQHFGPRILIHVLAILLPLVKRNDLGGTRAEHCGTRVFLGCYVFGAERQLLIPPHSLQAEPSGGTIVVVN